MLELADNASWSANATCSADFETPALFHPTRVYVALILSGLVATSKHNRSSGQMDARVWQSWATHVVDVLERSSAKVGTFLCLGHTDEPPEELLLRRLRVLHVDSSSLASSSLHGVRVPRLQLNGSSIYQDAGVVNSWRLHQWERLRLCFSRALAHERSVMSFSSTGTSQAQFTHFLRGRPDAVWLQPLPSLNELRAHTTVAVRALMLHSGMKGRHGDGPGYLPSDALVSQGCNKSPLCSHRRGACMVADDQFALVPRPYASAYFAQCRGLHGIEGALARQMAAALNAVDRGTRSAYYVRSWESEAYCRASCSSCSELVATSNKTFRAGAFQGTCTEVLLTSRLKSLGVPLSVAPFGFRLVHDLDLPDVQRATDTVFNSNETSTETESYRLC